MYNSSEVEKDLVEACSKSKRQGKWSSVNEVNSIDGANWTLKDLRRLVKDGGASEKVVKKVPQKLFKPATGGIGEGNYNTFLEREFGGGEPYEPPRGDQYPPKDPYNPNYPQDTPRRGDAPKDSSTRDTLTAGIGISILGGMGGGAGSSSIPRGSNFI